MFDFNTLFHHTHSVFDDIFGGHNNIVVQPVGGFTTVCLSDIDKIESILCLTDKNIVNEYIWGYSVISLQEIVKKYQDFKVLILSSIHYEEIKSEWVKFIPESDIIQCYNFDTRVHFNYFEEQYKKWIEDKKKLICFIYDRLADDISKKSFYAMLIGAEHYAASELMSICSMSPTEDPDYFHDYKFMTMSSEEDYLDVGAYDGDTVIDFIKASNGNYKSITAIEPDMELYSKLEKKCREIDSEKISCMCVGLSDTVSKAILKPNDNKYMNIVVEQKEGELKLETIDSLNKAFSLIKISVYNPECRRKIIQGGKNVLTVQKPKIIIQIERQTDDILDIPNEIIKINAEYKIYFRIMLYEQKGILRFNTAFWAI